MILADSNVWLALALSKHKHHAAARAWLSKRSAAEGVFFCRSTQQSFLRLLTTQAVLAPYGVPALSNNVAWQTYESFRADDRVSWKNEPHGLEAHWTKLTASAKASPKLWMDAFLAAFAIAGKHQLATTDKAFKQFRDLDLVLLAE